MRRRRAFAEGLEGDLCLELRAAGRLDGPPAVLRRASAIFAGPAPGMSDMF